MSYVGINFHGVGVPHVGVPAHEVPYWLGEARFAEVVGWIAAAQVQGRDVRVTFDDGNVSDLERAAPVLARHGVRATFFVLTGRLDDPRYLSRGQVRQLQALGHGIGLHGRDHLDWRGLDEAALAAETVGARAVLAEVAGVAIDEVAVPFGAYDRRVMARLKAAGFAAIHTSDGGPARDGALVRPRTSVRSDMDDAAVHAILAGRPSAARRLRRALSMWRRGGL